MGSWSVDKERSKVEEERNWPILKTVQDVLAFLGLAGFYWKFVHEFAEIARPLTDILKSTEFEESLGGLSPRRPLWSWMRRLSQHLRI